MGEHIPLGNIALSDVVPFALFYLVNIRRQHVRETAYKTFREHRVASRRNCPAAILFSSRSYQTSIRVVVLY